MLLADLVNPAVATLARAMADTNAPWQVRVTAARDVLDRTGYPRRLDVDLDQTKGEVFEMLLALTPDPDETLTISEDDDG